MAETVRMDADPGKRFKIEELRAMIGYPTTHRERPARITAVRLINDGRAAELTIEYERAEIILPESVKRTRRD